MKKIPLKLLKQNFANIAAKVAKGETYEVTKHNVAYICLVPAKLNGVRVGLNFGKAKLKPAVKTNATNGRYLDFLRDDRDGNEK